MAIVSYFFIRPRKDIFDVLRLGDDMSKSSFEEVCTEIRKSWPSHLQRVLNINAVTAWCRDNAVDVRNFAFYVDGSCYAWILTPHDDVAEVALHLRWL